MIVLHGLLPHWSDVNRSPVSRHAYSLHCISAAAEYPSWNWLQRPPSCHCAGSTSCPAARPPLLDRDATGLHRGPDG